MEDFSSKVSQDDDQLRKPLGVETRPLYYEAETWMQLAKITEKVKLSV